MPKRSNPFGECSPLQYKTHVGEKEIHLGVARDENMKIVYEKTKELLFKGSQKSFMQSALPTDANDNMISQAMVVERASYMEEIMPGQMCLDKGCQLTVPDLGSTLNGVDFQKNLIISSSKESGILCKMCKKKVTKLNSQACSFCDKPTCRACVRQCDSCAGNFCQLCSVLNYSEAMERAFCLNCL